ncbi:extracellular matrix regulator RemB [Massilibacterium senegalense]|uniref:extracellular matrix regulator RemB n=1 Tax=Massilibacterium senegalense TaxID=1632858 RepID=UPI0007814BE8|nr:extracellular matrix/biofilm biosynthesis regulator RemA family protein [Massilibacterium senegalense]
MYVHLGEHVVVPKAEMIAVLDAQTQDLASYKTGNQKVIQVAKDQIKSVVITKRSIYFLPVSTSTLKRRMSITPYEQ